MTAPREVSLSYAIYRVARLLLAEGGTNAQIGKRLYLTENTVKSHVKTLLRVTGCASRTEFMAAALNNRLRIHSGAHTSVMEVGEVA